MTILSKAIKASIALSALGLGACGGSGGGSTAGIGGTGSTDTTPVIVTGTIDGFGSIFVNGIEFETDDSVVSIDDDDGLESDLALGMVVTVRGSLNDDGLGGTAEFVNFDDDVQGPITSISENADATQKTLTVLGLSVLADKTSTIFDDVSYDNLAVNHVIEVSGFFDENDVLRATRIERKGDFQENVSEIELKGLVSNLSATTFTLDSFTVDFSSADLTEVPNQTLTDGMFVEVEGTLSGSTITATEVEEEDDLFDDNDNDDYNVSIQGIVTDYVDDSDFVILGQAVDASSASFSPSSLNLENGLEIEVEGTLVNGVLVATEVESRGGDVEFEAQVLDIDTTANTLTLGFVAGNVTINIDTKTRFEDDLEIVEPFTLGDIQAGDFLEVEARLDDTDIIATEINRDESDDDVIQGPVESFIAGTSVTVFGLTYSTTGAEFENSNDQPISQTAFYDGLTVGRLIKIKDEDVADGTADEVEFEN